MRFGKRFIPAALFGAGLIAASLPAAAQQYDPYYESRAPRPRPQNAGLLDRVQQDLDRASAHPLLTPHARAKLGHARQKIWEFQRKFADGRFDRGALDDALGSMRHAVNNESMDYQDRTMLSNDMADLRAFRMGRGYPAPGYGY
jgi:hypothetical protein